jgi:hypothetical protein
MIFDDGVRWVQWVGAEMELLAKVTMKYFSAFDANSDGELSRDEIKDGYSGRLCIPLLQHELDAVMALVESHPDPAWWLER